MITKGQENLARHAWWEAYREARRLGRLFSEISRNGQRVLFPTLF